MQSRTLRAAFAAVGVAGLVSGATAISSLPAQAIGDAIRAAKYSAKPNKASVAKQLEGRIGEIKELKDRAGTVTKAIGALASEGKLPTNDESIALLKTLVQELQDTNARLKKLEGEMEDVLGWIEGQNENIPIMQTDITQLKRVSDGNYVQFQWMDTQQDTGRVTNDGFQMRRFRISQTNKIDDKTSMKLSFDVSTGASRLSAELKDAHLIYDIEPSVEHVGKQLIFGQQPLPLGYELERSSTAREFPERALYNTTLFSGERDRGINFKAGLGAGIFAHVGMWSGMTVNDPQQSGNGFRDVDNRVAFTAGVRHYTRRYDVGISTLQGKRHGFVPTQNPQVPVPETDRNLIYIDGAYVGLLTEALSVRGELMFGKDRPPTGGLTNPTYRRQTDVLGWQGQLAYTFNPRNVIAIRRTFFDNDSTNSPNDITTSWGIAHIYYINPGARLTTAYEMFDEQGTEIRNNVWTIRLQFKL